MPDVAYNAGVNGGVLTHCGICNLLVGLDPNDPASSSSSAARAPARRSGPHSTADADQMAGHDIGNINQALYQFGQAQPHDAADFHDVTTGNNDVADIGGAGYNAGTGWDPVTGLGTPNAADLLPELAKKG